MKSKKIILFISLLLLAIFIIIFIFPKKSGGGGSGLNIRTLNCKCFGVEKTKQWIGMYKKTCFGIPYSCK